MTKEELKKATEDITEVVEQISNLDHNQAKTIAYWCASIFMFPDKKYPSPHVLLKEMMRL